MIKIIEGNIFASKCQAIVNTINCVGVMGAGIAYEFRLRYPEMYFRYVDLCKMKKMDIGLLWIYKSEEKWIVNFPTKYHWRNPSKIEYLEKGLQKFVDTYKEKGIKSIAFPLLGASNGGIPEEVSLKIMKKHLKECDIEIEIYKFNPNAYDDLYLKFKKIWTETPEEQLKKEISRLKEKENRELKEKIEELKSKKDEKYLFEIKNLEGKLRERAISITVIKKALENENIKSLNGLLKAKGIGEKTLEKAFHFINNFKKNEQELFGNNK